MTSLHQPSTLAQWTQDNNSVRPLARIGRGIRLLWHRNHLL